MAAVVERASIMTGNFGQFRLTQFVDSAPRAANATPNPPPLRQTLPSPSPSPSVKTRDTKGSNKDQMSPTSRPSSGQNQDHESSPTAAVTAAPSHIQPDSSSAGFGQLELVELASNPVLEGILGPNKDGRVRNPVPSKLKGKTDNKKGNFGVMHMDLNAGKKSDVAGREAAAERDAAARRTSEKTASAAKAAQQEGYIPPRRRRTGGDGIPQQEGSNRNSPFPSGTTQSDHRTRTRPLAPDETKHEQARLLTLLRSINPLTVVDQICKAVAYFGGIPGAPPPQDGIFPESANTRETGALFIGWLSEIFPDLSKTPEISQVEETPSGPVRRPRGRPKGSSKNSTPHRDKGITRESMPPNNNEVYGQPGLTTSGVRPAWSRQSIAKTSDDGWVNTSDVGALTDGVDQNHGVSISDAETGQAERTQTEGQPPATPINLQSATIQPNTTSMSKRGRGRPKGSRNKKVDDQRAAEGTEPSKAELAMQKQIAAEDGHQSSQTKATENATDANPGSNSVSSKATDQPVLTASQQSLPYAKQPWGGNSQNEPVELSASIVPLNGLTAEELAVLENYRNQRPGQAVSDSIVNETPVNQIPVGGMKRKRPPPKKHDNAFVSNQNEIGLVQTRSVDQTNAPQVATALPPTSDPTSMTKDTLQWQPQVDALTPVAPPAKKHRKSKDPNTPPSRRKTVTAGSKVTTSTIKTTITDSTVNSSQQNIPVSRPPAEGLEAHYERFTNLQQNSRGHTPSAPPQQRQQHHTPSLPHQLPQQTQQAQKGQQGEQREDQTMTQMSSTRPSTGFYGQPRQVPTYSQQYPSHQPSQLYGTQSQPSPRMSNSSNSYRAAPTHTLAHVSPQFSQVDNSYRTASPHALSQPSPSFSQTDNSYRTASTLAQPSPSFSSRPPQTQSSHQNQSQYGHFTDSSYIDLPTLESLGHSGSGSGGHSNVSVSTGAYGHGIGVGIGVSRTGSNGAFVGTSNSNSAFDAGTSEHDMRERLLRVSRSGSSSIFNNTSGLSNAFDTGMSEQDMRERLLRGLGRG